jgi:hypothetical protein
MAWFIWLLIGLAINIVAYLLLPKPKQEQPPEVADLDNPTASADRPAPVVFGTVLVKGTNVLDYRDKSKLTLELELD